MLEQARRDRRIGRHLGCAFVDGPYGVRQLDARIPQRGQQALDRLGACPIRCVRQQDQHVDVGMREELAAAVTADGDERRRRREVRGAPRGRHDGIGQPGESAQKRRRVGPGGELGAKLRAALYERAAPLIQAAGGAGAIVSAAPDVTVSMRRPFPGAATRAPVEACPPIASGSRSRPA
jgi:hypothetical protein